MKNVPGDFAGSYIVPPTETFERRLVIRDRDLPVELLHLGGRQHAR